MKDEEDSIEENELWTRAILRPGKEKIAWKMRLHCKLNTHGGIGPHEGPFFVERLVQENDIIYGKTSALIVPF